MKNDFLVTVVDPESAAEWSATIGTCTLHVESPLPAEDAGILVYRVDLGYLTASQRTSLVEHLSSKFHISRATVEQKLDRQGLPILAAYCSRLGPGNERVVNRTLPATGGGSKTEHLRPLLPAHRPVPAT